MSEKAKHGSPWPFRWLPFIVLWALNTLAVKAAVSAFVASDLYMSASPDILNMTELLMYVVGWMIQVQLVQRLLKHSMRGWMFYNLIGALMTLYLGGVVISIPGITPDQLRILTPLVFLSPTLVQTLWLWARIHKAWLWALTGALISLSHNLLYVFYARPAAVPLHALIDIAAGVITGSLMVYLWTILKPPAKPKSMSHQRPMTNGFNGCKSGKTAIH